MSGWEKATSESRSAAFVRLELVLNCRAEEHGLVLEACGSRRKDVAACEIAAGDQQGLLDAQVGMPIREDVPVELEGRPRERSARAKDQLEDRLVEPTDDLLVSVEVPRNVARQLRAMEAQ